MRSSHLFGSAPLAIFWLFSVIPDVAAQQPPLGITQTPTNPPPAVGDAIDLFVNAPAGGMSGGPTEYLWEWKWVGSQDDYVAFNSTDDNVSFRIHKHSAIDVWCTAYYDDGTNWQFSKIVVPVVDFILGPIIDLDTDFDHPNNPNEASFSDGNIYFQIARPGMPNWRLDDDVAALAQERVWPLKNFGQLGLPAEKWSNWKPVSAQDPKWNLYHWRTAFSDILDTKQAEEEDPDDWEYNLTIGQSIFEGFQAVRLKIERYDGTYTYYELGVVCLKQYKSLTTAWRMTLHPNPPPAPAP